MKTLLFLCGPNGIGKTTICKEIVRQLPRSAYVDSDPCRFMNPFVLDDATIPTIAKNISDLIRNYLNCPAVDTVIFSYGFHGRRKEVFQRVMDSLSDTPHRFVPFLLWCSEEENLRRMTADGRSPERVRTTLEQSRKSFDDLDYPVIDITELSVFEAAQEILKQAK